MFPNSSRWSYDSLPPGTHGVRNAFSQVCLSISVCVQAITFESFHIGTSFLVWRYVFAISRSILSIRVIAPRLYAKMIIYLFQLVIRLYVAKCVLIYVRGNMYMFVHMNLSPQETCALTHLHGSLRLPSQSLCSGSQLQWFL